MPICVQVKIEAARQAISQGSVRRSGLRADLGKMDCRAAAEEKQRPGRQGQVQTGVSHGVEGRTCLEEGRDADRVLQREKEGKGLLGSTRGPWRALIRAASVLGRKPRQALEG